MQITIRGTTVRLEHTNGELVNLPKIMGQLLKWQDLDSWAREPQAFQAWFRHTMQHVVEGVEVIIQRKS